MPEPLGDDDDSFSFKLTQISPTKGCPIERDSPKIEVVLVENSMIDFESFIRVQRNQLPSKLEMANT